MSLTWVNALDLYYTKVDRCLVGKFFNMAMKIEEIERLIKEGLPDAQIKIEDLRGDGDHYAAHVKSSAFKGLSRVKQHQLVYGSLKGRMGTELHALALNTSVLENN
tara:strand:+ start:1729 stop:2046 length:318 start_codon:yes stop_codon:yes gene_type:complete